MQTRILPIILQNHKRKIALLLNRSIHPESKHDCRSEGKVLSNAEAHPCFPIHISEKQEPFFFYNKVTQHKMINEQYLPIKKFPY